MEDYGKTMNKSWADIIDPPKPTKEEKELENIDCVELNDVTGSNGYPSNNF